MMRLVVLGAAFVLEAAAAEAAPVTTSCSSKPGERNHCSADTSKGVVLSRSFGEAPCLLGKSWGYDTEGVWVSDGCSAEFIVRDDTAPPVDATEKKQKPLEHIPNVGFLLYDGDKGQIYMRLFTYVRYLNQKGLDPTYVDAFGNTKTVPQRQDVQLNKFFLPFSGWFLTPKFRYYLYVWWAATTRTAARTSRASPAPTASRTARSGSRTAASSSRPTCSVPGSPWKR